MRTCVTRCCSACCCSCRRSSSPRPQHGTRTPPSPPHHTPSRRRPPPPGGPRRVRPPHPPRPPRAPPPPPRPPPPPLGPRGQPRIAPILDLLDAEFIGRAPRRESPLGCSGNARVRMIQLNEPQPERVYERAESIYYVLGGEGTLRMNGRDLTLATGHFAMIPRGISHAFTRRGRRPLILLAIL